MGSGAGSTSTTGSAVSRGGTGEASVATRPRRTTTSSSDGGLANSAGHRVARAAARSRSACSTLVSMITGWPDRGQTTSSGAFGVEARDLGPGNDLVPQSVRSETRRQSRRVARSRGRSRTPRRRRPRRRPATLARVVAQRQGEDGGARRGDHGEGPLCGGMGGVESVVVPDAARGTKRKSADGKGNESRNTQPSGSTIARIVAASGAGCSARRLGASSRRPQRRWGNLTVIGDNLEINGPPARRRGRPAHRPGAPGAARAPRTPVGPRRERRGWPSRSRRLARSTSSCST